MARRPRDRGLLSSSAQLSALASPIRQEIVDTLESLGGTAAVAQIAEQLGRPADGLYFHLRQMVRSRILEELPEDGSGRGRRYRTVAAPGRRVRLGYRNTANRDHAGLNRVVGSLLRVAKRDFEAALRRPGTVVQGAQRELWASRTKGWVSAADLMEMNRLLVRLNELTHQRRSARRNRLVSLAFVLAPMPVQPLRRSQATR